MITRNFVVVPRSIMSEVLEDLFEFHDFDPNAAGGEFSIAIRFSAHTSFSCVAHGKGSMDVAVDGVTDAAIMHYDYLHAKAESTEAIDGLTKAVYNIAALFEDPEEAYKAMTMESLAAIEDFEVAEDEELDVETLADTYWKITKEAVTHMLRGISGVLKKAGGSWRLSQETMDFGFDPKVLREMADTVKDMADQMENSDHLPIDAVVTVASNLAQVVLGQGDEHQKRAVATAALVKMTEELRGEVSFREILDINRLFMQAEETEDD